MLMPSIFGESLFDDFFDDFARPARSVARYSTPTMNVMRTDVKEDENGYELHIELPGYQKEDVKAQLKDGYLTINAESNQNKDQKDENGKFIRRERYYGTCSRSFYVGEDITEEDIKAKFENGILKVTVPKKEKAPAVEENKYIAIDG
ncbi:MAG: Hsp20/alpha crystallin family protein [Lachnospiraceae bacterium]|nr:Hsp20/alpha crystallin family protein [Lachnospiraceae bacterium]